MSSLPLLIAIPHSSGFVPQDIAQQMLGEDALEPTHKRALLQRLFLAGDPYTEQLFYVPGAHHLEATVSRFVVDLNRAVEHHGPNGVIKLASFEGAPLYPLDYQLSTTEVQQRLARYYQPYHQTYLALLPQVALYIDGHSMLPVGPQIGPDQGAPRPAICVMTGGDSQGEHVDGEVLGVPPEMARALKQLLTQHFATLLESARQAGMTYDVRLNDPWFHAGIGGFYPQHQALGFGLEFNQQLYLQDGKPIPGAIRRINQAFRNFAHDALALAQAYRR